MESGKVRPWLERLAAYSGKALEFYEPLDVACVEIGDAAALPSEPLVSVSMLCYNHEPYLREALDSVLNQQCSFPYEVLVGEDCSTDGSMAILREYQERFPEKLRILTSEHNVGVVANSLRVTARCRGKYVAFCECDDYWTSPHKLKKNVELLEAHPEVSMVFSRCHVVTASGTRRHEIMFSGFPPLAPVWKKILRGDYFIHTCTCCVRCDLLREVSFHSWELRCSLAPAGDTCVFVHMALHGKVGFLNESLGAYRLHGVSATHHESLKRTWDFALRCFLFGEALAEHYEGLTGYRAASPEKSFRKKVAFMVKQMFKASDFAMLNMVEDMACELHGKPPRILRHARDRRQIFSRLYCRLWLCLERCYVFYGLGRRIASKLSYCFPMRVQIHR